MHMKTFKEYLAESIEEKKYVFKVKIAGEVPDNTYDVLESSLQKYGVTKCTKGKSTPIQSKLMDFPSLENESMTVYEVELTYPTTSTVLTSYLSEHTGICADRLRVQTEGEEAEAEINDEHSSKDKKSSPLLLTPTAKKESNQELVGDKKVSSFLKDLAKVQKNHQPQQYKGVNDAILAKSLPKGTEK